MKVAAVAATILRTPAIIQPPEAGSLKKYAVVTDIAPVQTRHDITTMMPALSDLEVNFTGTYRHVRERLQLGESEAGCQPGGCPFPPGIASAQSVASFNNRADRQG